MSTASTATEAELPVTCPAVEALVARIRAEQQVRAEGTLYGADEPPPGFMDGLWAALRAVTECRYGVAASSRPGPAAAGWDVVDLWAADVIDWRASRRDAEALASEQGQLNAAEVRARIESGHE